MLPKNVVDKTGKRFGRLIASDFYGIVKHAAIWLCKCDCGGTKAVRGSDLERGAVQSCGCLKPNKKPPGEAAFNDLYRRYKYDAQGKDRKFTIPKTNFRLLVTSNCHYCGTPPNKETTYKEAYNGQFIYNGLDRVNNNLDYTIANVVPCCERCNKAKRGMSKEDFLTWIQNVFNHSCK